MDEKAFADRLYVVAADAGLEGPAFFKTVYMVLIGKERGPKLAGFIKTCGKEKVLAILNRY